jgi:hypothetical protein
LEVELLFVVYLTMLFQWLRLELHDGVSDKWWIRKDVGGSICGLILRYYPSICLEGLRKPIKNLSEPRFEPKTSQIWSMNMKCSFHYKVVRVTYLRDFL